jgi:hypothetical protein
MKDSRVFHSVVWFVLGAILGGACVFFAQQRHLQKNSGNLATIHIGMTLSGHYDIKIAQPDRASGGWAIRWLPKGSRSTDIENTFSVNPDLREPAAYRDLDRELDRSMAAAMLTNTALELGKIDRAAGEALEEIATLILSPEKDPTPKLLGWALRTMDS